MKAGKTAKTEPKVKAGEPASAWSARVRRSLEKLRARQPRGDQAETLAPRYCGKCEFGFIIKDGRARPCSCRGTRGRQGGVDQVLGRHRAGMPGRLSRVSAHTFLMRPGHEHIKPALDQYLRDLGAGKKYGFLIFGPSGAGKSYAAAYVVNTARHLRLMPAAMVNFPRMLSALRATFQDPDEHHQLLGVLYDTPLLVIDDLGMEQRVTEHPELSWSVSEFYKVIDYRREEELATIITTNRTLEELRERLGAPIMERIKDMTLRLDLAPPQG